MSKNKKKKSKKELMFTVESNGDLSHTVPLLSDCKDLIEGDMQDLSPKEQAETFYTITPKFMTEKQIIKLIRDGD